MGYMVTAHITGTQGQLDTARAELVEHGLTVEEQGAGSLLAVAGQREGTEVEQPFCMFDALSEQGCVVRASVIDDDYYEEFPELYGEEHGGIVVKALNVYGEELAVFTSSSEGQEWVSAYEDSMSGLDEDDDQSITWEVDIAATAGDLVERWTSDDIGDKERAALLALALNLPVLRHYAWEAPEEPDLEPGWVNEVLALYIDAEEPRRVFGFSNIQGKHGGTGLGWEEPEDLPESYQRGDGSLLRDYDLVRDTGYFA